MTKSTETTTEQSPGPTPARRLRGATRPRLIRSSATALGAVATVAILAAACSSSPTNSASSSSTTGAGSGSGSSTSATSGTSNATVKTAQNSTFGTVLVSSTGMALYTFGGDHGGQSACTGACAQAWPALTVAAGTTPTAGPGVTGTLATSRQANGALQVTYNGSLLYTFVSDQTPGQVTGNNVANFTVAKVSSSSSSGSGAGGGSGTTTTRGGSGY